MEGREVECVVGVAGVDRHPARTAAARMNTRATARKINVRSAVAAAAAGVSSPAGVDSRGDGSTRVAVAEQWTRTKVGTDTRRTAVAVARAADARRATAAADRT